jgi:hypothetical protein
LVLLPDTREIDSRQEYHKIFTFIGLWALVFIPKIAFTIFHFIEDISELIKRLVQKIRNIGNVSTDELPKISRTKFISQIGIVFASIHFFSILYAITKGRSNYKIKNQNLFFNNLPSNFDGLKIVQISDFHIGSFFGSPDEVEKAVNIINAQNPDLILFTGDMVNNFANEMEEFIDILQTLEAKYGKYAILGNHDYGNYIDWKSSDEKNQNQKDLVDNFKKINFNLLLNQNDTIKIYDQEISIIGVENWGLPPFPQYGNLKKAVEDVEPDNFKILLSHDPTHWDEQVVSKTNIDLTLSGHTHGMQMGIDVLGIKWSPVKFIYKRWSGLYNEKNQYLYVNIGLGFIAFPGRIGMLPEITVVELHTKV